MLIFLVGMPGSGKTTLAKSLAQALNISLIDLDAEIVKSERRSIESIFEKDGEEAFRKIEKDIVEKFSKVQKSVISTGGGAPCHYNNMDIMNQAGITIYLDVPPDELANRIFSQEANRPMVKGKTREELMTFLEQKIKERAPYYNTSQLKIRGSSISTDEVLGEINKIKV